jgi:hypothetical protein
MPRKVQDRVGHPVPPCSGCRQEPGHVRLVGAPRHARVLGAGCLRHAVASTLAGMPGVAGVCVACDLVEAEHLDTVFVDIGDYAGQFCRGHTVAFLHRGLRPLAFRRVLADAGDLQSAVSYLQPTWYTPDGEALVPMFQPGDPDEMISPLEWDQAIRALYEPPLDGP